MSTVDAGGAVEVIVGLVVTVPNVVEHPEGTVIGLESRVTAPVLARSLPSTVALVKALMDCFAITVPTINELSPSVAELPTCQKTLHELAPPVTVMLLAEPVMRVLAA